MHLRGQGSREVGVHAGDYVMTNENAVRPGGDPCLKGQKIGRYKGFIAALVLSDAGVGVHIVAIAGEMLEGAAHAASFHGRNYRLNIGAGCRRVLTEGTGIDKVAGVGGQIAHRRQIYVKAQVLEKDALFPGVPSHIVQPALGEQILRGGKPFAAKGRKPADTGNRAALFVHADEKGDVCCRLIAFDFRFQRIRCFPLHIVCEQNIAGRVILLYIRHRRVFPAADKEHLPYLFFQRHPIEDGIDPVFGGKRRLGGQVRCVHVAVQVLVDHPRPSVLRLIGLYGFPRRHHGEDGIRGPWSRPQVHIRSGILQREDFFRENRRDGRRNYAHRLRGGRLGGRRLGGGLGRGYLGGGGLGRNRLGKGRLRGG